MSQEQDKIFFRNYSIVLGILVVIIVVFFFLANILGENENLVAERTADQVSKRVRPVGDVRVAGEEETAEKEKAIEESKKPEQKIAEEETEESRQQVAAAEARSGKEIYNGLCVSCHGTGLPGSPQMGDTDEWDERIAKGKDTLYENAITGYTGPEGHLMPAKGGNPALSDEEVRNAVDYMLANSQ